MRHIFWSGLFLESVKRRIPKFLWPHWDKLYRLLCNPKFWKLLLPLSIACGLLAGMGLHTFIYAKGFSYASKDPKVCANCHIMQDQYDSWRKSSHHATAACVDCHLPYETIPGLIAKADNGWRHSKAFTLQNFHEPIRINERNSRILQKNCVRCHQDLVEASVAGGIAGPQALNCVNCHAHVGHGPGR